MPGSQCNWIYISLNVSHYLLRTNVSTYITWLIGRCLSKNSSKRVLNPKMKLKPKVRGLIVAREVKWRFTVLSTQLDSYCSGWRSAGGTIPLSSWRDKLEQRLMPSNNLAPWGGDTTPKVVAYSPCWVPHEDTPSCRSGGPDTNPKTHAPESQAKPNKPVRRNE